MMRTDHYDQLESTKSMLIEEKEIAINESEVCYLVIILDEKL